MVLAYSQPVDIANEGLQLLGVDQITATSFQAPDSKGAREMNRAYDKLRQAELKLNAWTFATRNVILRPIDTGTTLWTPPTYNAATTYSVGQVTVYNGDYYQAQNGVLVGDIPNIAASWLRYFGPLTLDPFDTTLGTMYFAGEIVIVPEAYGGGNTYLINSIVVSGGIYYVSLQGSNTGHTPASSPTWWTPYLGPLNNSPTTGPFVYTTFGAGPTVFLSLISGNQTLTSTVNWLSVGGTPALLQILYPINAGPVTQLNTANVYRLPNGFLRKAPTNPRGQQRPFVGGASYNALDDWIFEGNYITSSLRGPIFIRFVGDVIDVPAMDALFCRALAADLAYKTCEAITQASEKKAEAKQAYKDAVREAGIVNAIEVGKVDAPESPIILARL